MKIQSNAYDALKILQSLRLWTLDLGGCVVIVMTIYDPT